MLKIFLRSLLIPFFVMTATRLDAQLQSNKPVATLIQTPEPEIPQPLALSNTYSGPIKINYVRTRDAMTRIPDESIIDGLDYKQVKQTTQYLDGLGRPLQTV